MECFGYKEVSQIPQQWDYSDEDSYYTYNYRENFTFQHHPLYTPEPESEPESESESEPESEPESELQDVDIEKQTPLQRSNDCIQKLLDMENLTSETSGDDID